MIWMFAVAHTLLIFSISFFLSRRQPSEIKKFFWPALVVKILAGFSVGGLYQFYYQAGDTLQFFNDALVLSEYVKTNFGSYLQFLFTDHLPENVASEIMYTDERSFFFIKVTSIFSVLSGDNYWIASVYFSLISFAGAWYLLSIFHKHIPQSHYAVSIAFLFFPSVVFWSAGIIKESLVFASICILTAIFFETWFESRIKSYHILAGVISAWIIWSLKYYYAAIFFPVVLTCLGYKFILKYKPLTHLRYQLLLWMLIFTLPAVLVFVVHPNFYPDRVLQVIVENNAAFNAISLPDEVISYHNLEPTPESVLRNAPKALLSTLFRPFIFEANDALKILAALENLLLLILAIAAVRHVKSFYQSPHKILIFAAVLYIVLLAVFLGLSAPNFGTLSRYRVGFLPFFILLCTIRLPIFKKST